MSDGGDYAYAHKGEDGQWYGRVYAANHEQVFSTEGHAHRADVMELLQSRGFPIQEPPE